MSSSTTDFVLHFVAGAAGGTIGAVLTCPLEVVKTRLQGVNAKYNIPHQVMPHHSHGSITLSAPRFRVFDTFRMMVNIGQYEGTRALFRGMGANVAGVAPSRAIYFASFKTVKGNLSSVFGLPAESSRTDFIAATFAGVITSTITCPIWLVKTRIQLQTDVSPVSSLNNPTMRNYTSYADACGRILREEGVRGFYKGLSASYWNVLEGALQFAMYNRGKQYLLTQQNKGEPLSQLQVFSVAAASKLVAATLTYPLELVRTRLREQRTGVTKYRSVTHTLATIYKEEGFRALYGGLEPHLLRVVPNAAIMFVVVELLTRNGI